MNKKRYSGGAALVGCVLVGTAVGMLTKNMTPYVVLGLGVGLVLVTLIKSSKS